MLDTNIVSDMMRNPAGRVAARIAAVGEGNVCISIVTAAELRFGAARSTSDRFVERADAMLARLTILPLDAPADRIYGRLRADLQARGQPIGPNDLFIAAHALARDCTMVTANVREFERVPGLSVENWTA